MIRRGSRRLSQARARVALILQDHCLRAHLPAALARRVGPFGWPVITWEQLHDACASGRAEDHWLALLRIALERYDELVSRGSMASFGANNEAYMTGAGILRLHRAGRAPAVMGRKRGLRGPVLASDIATGRWRDQRYETRSLGPPPNRNWFTVGEFVALALGDQRT